MDATHQENAPESARFCLTSHKVGLLLIQAMCGNPPWLSAMGRPNCLFRLAHFFEPSS